MEAYVVALRYAIPIFILLVAVEYWIGIKVGKRIARGMDTISSLSSGITMILRDLLGLGIVIVSYEWMLEHFALFVIPDSRVTLVVSFILVDFASYWSHRWNHEINILWNRHIVHHSSEEFNLSCALRQSISDNVAIYFFLFAPLALLGVPAGVVATLAPIHLFLQFWYHTRLIDRLGVLEHILMTPSHHRVHHAINPAYIDKNYSAIFIVWDKWFGTFVEEQRDNPPVYGVSKPVATWNPIIINYVHLWGLVQDAWRTKSWIDKIRLWFMPTGWRPGDVKDKYPRQTIEDVFDFEKYEPPTSSLLRSWSWFQFVLGSLLLFALLLHYQNLSRSEVLWHSLFLGLHIFSYSSTMDLKRIALGAEVMKVVVGVYVLVSFESWLGLAAIFDWFMAVYMLVSLLVTALWVRTMRYPPGHWSPQ